MAAPTSGHKTLAEVLFLNETTFNLRLRGLISLCFKMRKVSCLHPFPTHPKSHHHLILIHLQDGLFISFLLMMALMFLNRPHLIPYTPASQAAPSPSGRPGQHFYNRSFPGRLQAGSDPEWADC